MIRIIKNLLNYAIWRFIFNQINRLHFVNFTNNFIAQLLTMTTRDILNFLGDLIFNKITNNFFFRLITNTPGINPSIIIDSKSKKIILISFVSTLILYRQFLLFKRFILWPFKLGIYSFFYAIFGFDVSGFLTWFDYFPLNIPQWVYVQYITLYSNWLNWWKGTVEIKNLNTDSIPSINKTNSVTDLTEGDSNNWINKKNIIIGLTVIALIGVGVWYYFYYSANGIGNGGAGNGGNNLPPQDPTQNLNPTIEIFDRQTGLAVNTENLNDTQRLALVDRADRLRNSGRISGVEHQQLLNNILPPAPSYEGPVNIPTNEGSTSTPITAQTDVPEIVVQPATPIEGSSQAQMGDIPRPPSPAGSDDSSETIRNYSYGDPDDRRYAFSRRSFDPSYRRDN